MPHDSEPKEDSVLTAEDFMIMLKISPNTFNKLLAEGSIPAPLPLGNRNRRWSRAVVIGFLQKPYSYNTFRNTQPK
jgi:predicted DNA-binding transcriptional regulator AlpA